MELNRYFLDVIKNHYTDFDGKATRSQFWHFVLYYALIYFVLGLLDYFILNPMLGITFANGKGGGLLETLFTLIVFIPTLAIGVRRLHDIDMSGWWMLLAFIPIVGTLALLYLWIKTNR